jgi:hypothetical protein
MNTKIITTEEVGNPFHGLGQTEKYGRVKAINWILTLPSC